VFSVGAWGDWLNQIIPCGAIEALPNVAVTIPCTLFNNRPGTTTTQATPAGRASLPVNQLGLSPILRVLAGG
jgi:hypothetical protein